MGDRVITSVAICERTPLYRTGLAQVLTHSQLFVTGDFGVTNDCVALIADKKPHLLAVGTPEDATTVDLAIRARIEDPNIAIMVFIEGKDADHAASLWSMGCEAVLGRRADIDEIRTALSSIRHDERALAPEFRNIVAQQPGFERPPHDKVLTAMEIEILRHVAAGLSNEQIARKIERQPETIKTHLRHVYAKLQVHNRHEAVERSAALRLLG